jgi:DNA-binding NtrC family response regulator
VAAILVVEDDVLVRQIAEMMIDDWGHSILSASDVDEALVVLRSDTEIHALFTDVYLKTAIHGGFDLAQQAVSLRPNLRVLYTTGHAISEHMRSLFVDGAKCLPKPYTEQELKLAVGLLVAN